MKNKLNGWIDEFGKFYPCESGEHVSIFPQGSYERNKIKITTYSGGKIHCAFTPTQAQINKVHEWCEVNDKTILWKRFEFFHLDKDGD